jgi:hypothetical protein
MMHNFYEVLGVANTASQDEGECQEMCSGVNMTLNAFSSAESVQEEGKMYFVHSFDILFIF